MAPLALLLSISAPASQGETPPVPGLVSHLPPVARIAASRRETWKVRRMTPRVIKADAPDAVTTTVDGRRVVLRPGSDYTFVEAERRGRDGSLLIYRWNNDEPFFTSERTIWYRGKETHMPYGYVTKYRDRLNYAGYFARAEDPMGPIEDPAEAYVIENGKYRWLGIGKMLQWYPDGLFVLEVPVDKKGNLLPCDFMDRVITRLIAKEREQAVSGYQFLGREKDGTVVLASKRWGGFVHPDPATGPNTRLLRWRKGRFLTHWELPPNWEVAGFSPDGWLLLHMHGSAWDGGILRDGVLTAVTLPKPKDSPFWEGYVSEFGADAFRFEASVGKEQREYRASPQRRSHQIR